MKTTRFTEDEEQKELLRLSTAGNVDDGKSTLIGRQLHDSKGIFDDQLDKIKAKNGPHKVDWALLTDGLKAEREQGITIDVAYRYFATPKRKFIIADTPGHEQYTRNMVTGASTADLAIILIDARHGVRTQSKRHSFIASLLRIPHLVVAVNKMDLVDYRKSVFEEIREDFTQFATKLQFHDLRFIPISALEGDNVVEPGPNMPWYRGEPLLSILEDVHIASDRNLVDLRFPVQYVLRPDQDFRGYCGQVASGTIRRGESVLVLPSLKVSRIQKIMAGDRELDEAFPPMSVAVTLDDEVDVSRGDMIVHRHNRPKQGRHIEAMLVWMDETPLDPGRRYLIKQTTQTTRVVFDTLHYRINVNTLERNQAETLKLNEIGRVVLTSYRALHYDTYVQNKLTGSFILIDETSNLTMAAGMIIDREPVDQQMAEMNRQPAAVLSRRKRAGGVSLAERRTLLNQAPVTLWFTGLVSTGKSSLAYGLERGLFQRGALAKVLDGGTFRRALSRELAFNTRDIAENLRRAAETAQILNEAGLIAICSFVSPLAHLREQARQIIGPDRFVEVFLDAPVAWCAERDETGLYEGAKRDEVQNLAGVNAPYETPETPDLRFEMDRTEPNAVMKQILTYLETKGFLR